MAEAAGLVLVRQRPGSRQGRHVHHDRGRDRHRQPGGLADALRTQRRIILAAGMIAVQGRIQREGEVVHLVAHHLTDLSAIWPASAIATASFPLPHGRGDEFHHGSPGIDPRSLPPKGPRPGTSTFRICTSIASR